MVFGLYFIACSINVPDMDYETFGEHQRKETGIFDFIRYLSKYIEDYGIKTIKIDEIAKEHNARGKPHAGKVNQ